MKDLLTKQAEAKIRNSAYADLSVRDKFKRSLRAPGNCERQLRKLTRDLLKSIGASEREAARFLSTVDRESLRFFSVAIANGDVPFSVVDGKIVAD